MSDQEPHRASRNEGDKNDRPSSHRGGNRDRARVRRHGQPQRPHSSFNMDELHALVKLITENGLTEFEFENDAIRVRLCRDNPSSRSSAQRSGAADLAVLNEKGSSTSAGLPSLQTPRLESSLAQQPVEEKLHTIPSPIVGTFYRSSSPTSEPFVRIGTHVGPDSVVCIIEAMKLMNEIQAETAGEIVKIYVENGQPVEYGQPLFGVKQ